MATFIMLPVTVLKFFFFCFFVFFHFTCILLLFPAFSTLYCLASLMTQSHVIYIL